MGTFEDLGTFTGNSIIRNGDLRILDRSDVYKFSLSNNGQINLNLNNISAGDDANLRLYQDTNNNGILDFGDQNVARSLQSGNADDVINYTATSGTYFAQVIRYAPGSNGIVSYDLELSGSTTTTGTGTTPTSKPNTYQPFNPNEVFSLNSNPDADHIIYLDFNGHTTTGTDWNDDYGNPIVTPAYDTDGDTSNFSTAEKETIWHIWQRVAEDFSPFNVNVTTAQPSEDQLKKTSGSDSEWGIRVVIGGDGSWYNKPGVVGVGYLDSFNDDIDTPTFVFSEVYNGSEKGVAETISHEVGHTLGLEHDGNFTTEYYTGHGSGPTGWAPIMGNSDLKDLTQWSQGDYIGASNQEDDLDIITGQNGFGYRQDDYSNWRTGAAGLSINDGQVENYGIIEKNNDIDWFQFNSTTGNIALDIEPFERGANLDILARLYDASGQLISFSNPIGSLSASFNVDLDPGQYYLSVEGIGERNVITGGYSDYGSLGQYSITGTIA
ncbi:pre-peptidase C-terminal domain-containing protein [Moorena producens]|uniref:PPC domain-containing protein n=1 Tax=Moorena producens TaxID=1155739 RepID=UPI003C745D1F